MAVSLAIYDILSGGEQKVREVQKRKDLDLAPLQKFLWAPMEAGSSSSKSFTMATVQ